MRMLSPGATFRGQTHLAHVGTLNQTPIIDSLHYFLLLRAKFRFLPQQERRISLGGFTFCAENVNMLFPYTKKAQKKPGWDSKNPDF